MNHFEFAFRNLQRRRTRSILTILGVAFAVGSFIALYGLSRSVHENVERSFDEHGTDLTVKRRGIAEPFGGTILETTALDFDLPIWGEVHLVTSIFFDAGVYLIVVGMMLDIVRSLGTGIDRHIAEAAEDPSDAGTGDTAPTGEPASNDATATGEPAPTADTGATTPGRGEDSP